LKACGRVWGLFVNPALIILCGSESLKNAAVAQQVERVLGKDEVMGSTPISS
jgi:hypothetical protein